MGLKALKPKKLKETIFYLGASFIKLAQVLATRSDFFSKEYLDELKELHDKLPKMSKADFEDIFKDSLNTSSKSDLDIFGSLSCSSFNSSKYSFEKKSDLVAKTCASFIKLAPK